MWLCLSADTLPSACIFLFCVFGAFWAVGVEPPHSIGVLFVKVKLD